MDAKLEYQTPALISYGKIRAITGDLQCSHYDKVGLAQDALTTSGNDLDGTIICDPHSTY